MSETFFEKWRHRISTAWDVLIGRAYACYFKPDDIARAALTPEPWPQDAIDQEMIERTDDGWKLK